MRGITPTRRYKVKYKVNGEILEDTFSCFMNIEPEIEINSELDDKYFWDSREILEIKPTTTPEQYLYY